MKAHSPATSLILLLLCYAPLPIHSHGVYLLKGAKSSFQIWQLKPLSSLLSHGEIQHLSFIQGCRVQHSPHSALFALPPHSGPFCLFFPARQFAGRLCRGAEILLKSTCDTSHSASTTPGTGQLFSCLLYGSDWTREKSINTSRCYCSSISWPHQLTRKTCRDAWYFRPK